ncbi:NAD(P)-dependent oxidoreductase [Companilactobacillus baiquanensis]|uniref:NAD(P)-dependent oxidoreductase n=1 Tax=Companilactobacillus baiquanensis TaxID=2486005 RepID=A0ABW1UXD9_9LACO|nr:NAD(P)-binding oxidoreductase [Companilactobacillus baiquanensis]
MKILIIGATGPTGRKTIESALDLGDTVTAFARHTESLNDIKDKINIISGDAILTSDLEKAMIGQDAVISTLGRGGSMQSHNLFTRAAVSIVNSCNHTQVPRLIWLSSFGVGETYKDATATQKIVYKTFLRNIYANKKASERIIHASKLNWTVVYPSTLTNGQAKGKYNIDEHIKMHGLPSISREDVADFLCAAAHDNKWIRRNAVITD